MPAAARPATTSPAIVPGSGTRSAGRGASAPTATSLPSAPASPSAAQAASTAPPRVASAGLANCDLGTGDRLGDAHGVEGAAIVEAEELGASVHRERGRRRGRPLAALRRLAALPRAGENGAEKVLPRQREVERATEGAQLAEAAEDLEVV